MTVSRALLMATALAGCQARNSAELNQLVQNARADRARIPELFRHLAGRRLVVIGWYSDPGSDVLTLQDFKQNGQSFIPVFSDQAHFERETAGSEYEKRGLAIDCGLLASALQGNERLVLDPSTTS